MRKSRVLAVSLALLFGSLFAMAEPVPAAVSGGAPTTGEREMGLPERAISAQLRSPRPPSPASSDLAQRLFGAKAAAAAPPPARTLPGAQALMRRVASLHSCASDDTFLCGKVTAPLDRFGMGSKTVDVRYMVSPHTGAAAQPKGAIFMTSGGPGNSITGADGEMYPFRDFVLPQLTDTYDLVFVDQRGVGRSDVLRCRGLQNHSYDSYARAKACAAHLGRERNFYGTAAIAEDIDDIRADLGYEEIVGMGGSYAGADWVTYAARHPEHTARIMVASPAPPITTAHPFDDKTAKALPGYVVRACERSNCDREFAHPRRLVAWLIERLRRHPVSGRSHTYAGDPVHVRVTERSLAWQIMLNGDFPFFYAEITAAAAALRHGDKVPLLRLGATHQPIGGSFSEGPVRDFSMAANLARICVDDSYVWDEDAPASTRRAQYAKAKAGQPRRYGLFSSAAWAAPVPVGFFPSVCIANRWQHRPAWKPGTRVGSVPTLILTGDIDNGLSTSISRQMTHVLTDSTLIEVEQAGHNPYFWRACARKMVRGFITREATKDLCAGKPFVKHWEPGNFADDLDGIPAARPGGKSDESTLADRRLATVTAWSIFDTIQQVIQSPTQEGRGLRGGTTSAEFPGFPTPDVYRLHRVRFTDDVRVSGKGYWDFENGVGGDFRVKTRGVDHARLRVRAHWYLVHPGQALVRGRIDGRHVEVRVPMT